MASPLYIRYFGVVLAWVFVALEAWTVWEMNDALKEGMSREDDEVKTNHVWLRGHTGHGTALAYLRCS